MNTREKAEELYDELARFYDTRVGTSFPKKDSSLKSGFINRIQEALNGAYQDGYKQGKKEYKENDNNK